MSNLIPLETLAYFRPPHYYFWQWSEEMEIIEWRDGRTISYREDMMPLLSALIPDGVPPLGTVLLLLSACKDNWQDESVGRHILEGLRQHLPAEVDWQVLHGFLTHVLEFMDIINSLPRELRSGRNRIHLIREIAEVMPNKLVRKQSQLVVEEFRSGRLDDLAIPQNKFALLKTLEQDVENMTTAYGHFPTRETLETLLRTGLKKLPPAGEDPLPQKPPLDLLSELAQDQETEGLARLTRRVMAAIKIPLQSTGASDMPLGGVSDITNRGELDRLLLSELAHDDLTLTARLVNNEALYLRREEPPQDPIQQRVILLDATLRMWGLPKVFAMATALACTENNPHQARVVTHVLGGDHALLADLSKKEGVVHALEQMHPALQCSEALKTLLQQKEVDQHTETVLITSIDNLQDHQFGQALASLTNKMQYLIVVNRSGQVHLYRLVNGRRKLLVQAKYDLELLLKGEKTSDEEKVKQPGKTAFIGAEVMPLYCPSSRFYITADNSMVHRGRSLIGITDDHRLLYWESRSKGALEVLPFVEVGRYTFGTSGSEWVYVLVEMDQPRQLKLYVLKDFELIKEVVIDYPQKHFESSKTAFGNDYFYLKLDKDLYKISAKTGHINSENEDESLRSLLTAIRPHPKRFGNFKRLINSGYNMWTSIERVYINELKQLCLDKRALTLTAERTLKILPQPRIQGRQELAIRRFSNATHSIIPENPHLQFSFARWGDEVEVIIDYRGFLHLRTTDNSLPEITLTLILGKQLAGWTSDGLVFGSQYFQRGFGTVYQPQAIYYGEIGNYIKKILKTADE